MRRQTLPLADQGMDGRMMFPHSAGQPTELRGAAGEDGRGALPPGLQWRSRTDSLRFTQESAGLDDLAQRELVHSKHFERVRRRLWQEMDQQEGGPARMDSERVCQASPRLAGRLTASSSRAGLQTGTSSAVPKGELDNLLRARGP
jgi:hypothetical protein